MTLSICIEKILYLKKLKMYLKYLRWWDPQFSLFFPFLIIIFLNYNLATENIFWT